MASSRYIHFEKNIFKFFKNAAHAEKIKNKDPADKVLDHNKFNETYPLKLHITLNRADYVQHEESLTKIILKYVSDGMIFSFKDINFAEANAAVERLKYRLTAKSISDQTLIKTNISIKRFERYLDGDQFTIYIPEKYNPDQILMLCQELEKYLNENQVTPGEDSVYAVGITKFINARKAYLDDDPVRVNASFNDEDKETDDDLIHRSHEEISNDPLYVFLKERMATRLQPKR